MKASTLLSKRSLVKISAIAFWIIIWGALALFIDSDLIIASPWKTLETLGALVVSASFWKSIAFSFLRITLGFLGALVLGLVTALVSAKIGVVKALLQPITSFIKATPVASFIVLAIIWFGSRNLSIFISFLMAFPIIYLNLLQGVEAQNKKLLEMAQVFKMGLKNKVLYIQLPQLMPYLVSACSIAMGLCWKSGIAAEVIGISAGSIGERLYNAKLYFETGELFAWTAVIVLFSTATEKLFMLCLKFAYKKIIAGAENAKTSPLPHPEKAKIVLDAVDKSYGDDKILQSFSLEIPSGKRLAVSGKSGAGKTTLTRLILGLEKPTTGEIVTQNASFSAVFQEDRLLGELSAVANIKIATGNDGSEILRNFGFTDDLMHKKASDLSGGEKRRVAIARALLKPASVYIFDEPFKGIDNQTLDGAVIPKVNEITSGKTVILVTHSQDEANAVCDEEIEI